MLMGHRTLKIQLDQYVLTAGLVGCTEGRMRPSWQWILYVLVISALPEYESVNVQPLQPQAATGAVHEHVMPGSGGVRSSTMSQRCCTIEQL